jgi:hypothetical protein
VIRTDPNQCESVSDSDRFKSLVNRPSEWSDSHPLRGESLTLLVGTQEARVIQTGWGGPSRPPAGERDVERFAIHNGDQSGGQR